MKNATALLTHIVENVVRIPETGCHIWMGATLPKLPYGQIRHKGKVKLVHRVVYELYKGPIPAGLYIMHSCDIPCCVNPTHLVAGTPTANLQDCYTRERRKPTSTLTAKQVAEIKIRLAGTESCHRIARDYGVNSKVVLNIHRGVSFKKT